MNTPTISRLFQRFASTAACALALLLAGCNDPEEYILWSPDGEHGIVRNAETTAVVNADGTIVGHTFAASAEGEFIQAQA